MEYRFDLEQFKNPVVSSLYGKTRGANARVDFKLDDIDNSDDTVIFIIPIDTFGISLSFYMSLLSDSANKLGEKDFISKYKFEIEAAPPSAQETLINELSMHRKILFNK